MQINNARGNWNTRQPQMMGWIEQERYAARNQQPSFQGPTSQPMGWIEQERAAARNQQPSYQGPSRQPMGWIEQERAAARNQQPSYAGQQPQQYFDCMIREPQDIVSIGGFNSYGPSINSGNQPTNNGWQPLPSGRIDFLA